MEKKIKDLTIEEIRKLCNDCGNCQLYEICRTVELDSIPKLEQMINKKVEVK